MKVTIHLIALIVSIFLCLNSVAQENDNPYFSVVLIPDTQFYAETYHDIFFAQTEWIKENIEKENIKMVIHLGDIVQNYNNKEEEWQIARKAFQTIDGHVPYTVAPGNHDMDVDERDSSLYNKYFPYTDYEDQSWYGGHFGGDNDNNYTFFESDGMNFMVLNLEYQPTDDIMDWANQVIDKHPEHRIILATHRYLHHNGRIDNGNRLWDRVINKNHNIFMIVCGHHTGYATMISPNDKGENVYQILTDYQGMEGGKGWMRILRFYPENDQVHSSEFSPVSTPKDRGIRSTLMMHYEMGES